MTVGHFLTKAQYNALRHGCQALCVICAKLVIGKGASVGGLDPEDAKITKREDTSLPEGRAMIEEHLTRFCDSKTVVPVTLRASRPSRRFASS